jgi:hypothetical protein
MGCLYGMDGGNPMKPTNEQRRKLIELIRNEPALGQQPTHGGTRKIPS